MGLLDTVSRVLTVHKADISDAVSKLKSLKGAEAERAKAEIENSKRISESLDGQLKMLGKLALGIGAAYAAGKTAIESYKFSLEASRLEQGAAGVSMEGLRKASAGLKSEMDLLRDAVKFKSAAEKMSQRDMEDVEGAMRALIGRGKDAQKVNEAITQSLTKLSTEGLQELGIHVEKAGLSMDDAKDRGELFKRVMQQLRTESLGVADAELTKQERMMASGVAFENAIDTLKKSLGEMVVALAPIVEMIAKVISYLPRLPGYGKTLGGKMYDANQSIQDAAGGLLQDSGLLPSNPYATRLEGQSVADVTGAAARRFGRAGQLRLAGNSLAADRLAAGGSEDLNPNDVINALGSILGPLASDGSGSSPVGKGYKGKSARDAASAAAAAAAKQKFEELRRISNEWAKNVTDDLVTQLEDEQSKIDESFATFGEDIGDSFGKLGDLINKGAEQMTRGSRYDALNRGRSQGLLEQMFGPIEDFNKYSAAFGLLSSAVTGAMDAWITGSESMGTAIKKALAQGIKALASELAINALKHGAYALGSLAFGDVRGASMHGLAAAKFAAGAVAAAVVARQMGHGGADYGAQGGGGAGAGGAAPRPRNDNAGPRGGNTNTVMIIGDPHDTETNSRRRTANAKRIVKKVSGDSGGGSF